ncbi:hypothetical protein V500_10632, partial [Pseudogymnoascus sp. VKM F-4518 (FW-2643)]
AHENDSGCRQQRSAGASRPDTTWVYVDSKGKEEVVAILEFKNTKILRKYDFDPAAVSTASEACHI